MHFPIIDKIVMWSAVTEHGFQNVKDSAKAIVNAASEKSRLEAIVKFIDQVKDNTAVLNAIARYTGLSADEVGQILNAVSVLCHIALNHMKSA